MLLDNKFISSIYYLVNKLDPLVFHIPQISYLCALRRKKYQKSCICHIYNTSYGHYHIIVIREYLLFRGS